ncbi:hypothetical protein [Mycobacteroides abscessus]|uniref:hypothetical protein n=1 Tax=Mycobacteroides abscessus TaxID=36809 RepID=UPI00092BA965|nr:hypothetical protein [Mycobacteroides abscessus]SIC58980.1 Uncharacterised protein [Mycobacteroides abscessus subsp. abscessus]
MGYKQLRVSDISGRELTDDEAVTVVVKNAGKVFDAAADELTALKAVNNVVELEYRYPNGQVATVLVPKAEFNKLVPEDKLAGFDSNRGRRSGYSPKQNGALV